MWFRGSGVWPPEGTRPRQLSQIEPSWNLHVENWEPPSHPRIYRCCPYEKMVYNLGISNFDANPHKYIERVLKVIRRAMEWIRTVFCRMLCFHDVTSLLRWRNGWDDDMPWRGSSFLWCKGGYSTSGEGRQQGFDMAKYFQAEKDRDKLWLTDGNFIEIIEGRAI